MLVNVKILFFAAAKEKVGGQNVIQITLNAIWQNKDLLIQHICKDVFNALEDLMPSLALAINEEYVIQENQQICLNDDDVLALIPPITGG